MNSTNVAALRKLAQAMSMAAAHLNGVQTEAVSGMDVGLQPLQVLLLLQDAPPGGVGTMELAARLPERAPGITALVDGLESRGLISRERSTDDRRLILNSLTDAGRKTAAQASGELDSALETAFFSLTHYEVAGLTKTMERLINT